jgi:hypothetical protein
VARQAQADGVAARMNDAELDARLAAYVWSPRYATFRPDTGG